MLAGYGALLCSTAPFYSIKQNGGKIHYLLSIACRNGWKVRVLVKNDSVSLDSRTLSSMSCLAVLYLCYLMDFGYWIIWKWDFLRTLQVLSAINSGAMRWVKSSISNFFLHYTPFPRFFPDIVFFNFVLSTLYTYINTNIFLSYSNKSNTSFLKKKTL